MHLHYDLRRLAIVPCFCGPRLMGYDGLLYLSQNQGNCRLTHPTGH
jgi:hypothetical protein